MKRAFICAASTPEALSIFRQRQNALIPPEFRLADDTLLPISVRSTQELETQISERVGGSESTYDLVVLLYEAGLDTAVMPFRQIFWTTSFKNPGHDQFGNHMGRKIARILKSIGVLQKKMEDHVGQQALLLPIANFHSEKTYELWNTIYHYETAQDFSSAVSIAISEIVADHRKPRRLKERSQQRFFVDARQCSFHFGYERHGQADTACPPHRHLCALSAVYRFGMRFDNERHFNVTHSNHSTLTVEFDDCHGEQQSFKSVSHVNMWPNDYCRA